MGVIFKTMENITLKEFVEKYKVPLLISRHISGLALVARNVKDSKKLRMAAKKYLEAENKFLEILEELNFE